MVNSVSIKAQVNPFYLELKPKTFYLNKLEYCLNTIK